MNEDTDAYRTVHVFINSQRYGTLFTILLYCTRQVIIFFSHHSRVYDRTIGYSVTYRLQMRDVGPKYTLLTHTSFPNMC
jgi:hypothetical protein